MTPTAARRIKDMQTAYPALQVVSDGTERSTVWEGWLQPMSSTAELPLILDDLDHNRPVDIVRGERYGIAHAQNCSAPHGECEFAKNLTTATKLYKVRIEDFGDERHPSSRILEPFIPPSERRHHRGSDGICAYAPWEHPWLKDESSIVDFTDQTLIWLLKQSIFSESGRWLGRETRHDSRFLLQALSYDDTCHCGSGKTYLTCHRAFDVFWSEFESWRRRHNSRIERFTGILRQARSSRWTN